MIEEDAKLLRLIEEEQSRRASGNKLPERKNLSPESSDLDILKMIESEESRRASLKDKEFHWPRFIVEQAGQGVLALPDLLVAAHEALERNKAKQVASGNPPPIVTVGGLTVPRENTEEDIEGAKKVLESPVKLPSDIIIPETQVPKTGFQRMAGHTIKGASSMLIPGGALSSALKAIPKLATLGAAQGLTSGALQEMGITPWKAELSSAIGVPSAMVGASLAKNALGISALNREAKVGQYLKDVIGKDVKNVSENISNRPSYATTGYQPLTAEIVENPEFAKLHRMRYETVGSEMPKKVAENRQALEEAFEKYNTGTATPQEIKGSLEGELSKRKKARYEATHERYESAKNKEIPVESKNLNAFLEKEKGVRGDLRKDLKYVSSEVKSGHKEINKDYIDFYEKLSPEARHKVEKPAGDDIYLKDLIEIDKAINSRIKKYRNSGEDNRRRFMIEAKEALNKDLDAVPAPEYKSVRKEYRELSKPIEEITKNKFVKGLMSSRANELVPSIYGKNSFQNVKDLKGIIGDNEALWNDFREASIQHLKHSISNAGAEGKHTTLSYPKLNRFLNQNENALSEVLDANQMQFLGELKSALKGQNIAKTLGKGEGSPTANRLATMEGMNERLGIVTPKNKTISSKAAEEFAGFAPKWLNLRYSLNRYMQNKNSKILSVLDEALTNPDVAYDLLNSQFKNQKQFNDYMNWIGSGAYGASSVASEVKNKK